MTPPLPSTEQLQWMLMRTLDASLDAGLLISHQGYILHSNKGAIRLFGDAVANQTASPSGYKNWEISKLVSFYSHSVESDGPSDDELEPSAKKQKSKMKEGDKKDSPSQGDILPWGDVVLYSSGVMSGGSHVQEWMVTGNIHASQKAGQPQEPATRENESARTGESEQTEPSDNQKRTFPGIIKLTPFEGIPELANGQESSGKKETVWLAFVRHADSHDILNMGVDGSVGSSSKLSRVRRSSRMAGTANREPLMTVDDQGIIVDINGTALRGSKRGDDPKWSWLTPDLIGKHISEASRKRQESQDMNQSSQKKRKYLQVIIESKFDPGHSACPGSGYLLRPKDYDTALTTGNAVREENITEAVFEAALDPIFQINEHGTIQMVNSAAINLFGWRRHEFIGRNISMICGGGHSAHHDSYMARYLATGETRVIGRNRELLAKRKDNSEFPIELAVVEVDTYAGDTRLFCGFVRDLTEIKARERMAQEIVEVALDPMFQINETGTIQMVNRAALTTFGYEREELVGKNISIICGGAHGANHDHYLRKYMRTGSANVIGKYRELPAKRKDGSQFLIQLAVVEIQSGGKNGERTFCGFVHNLSRQKRDNDIMRGTIDTSLDPVLHVNENGIIQLVNHAVVEQLGYSREELIGENVSIIVGSDHAKNHGKYIERYLETGERRAIGKKRKVKARRKDGSEMNIELGLSEIKIVGSKERLFCAFLRPA